MSESCIPVTFVIFGASGDLTKRKLIPALFSNFIKGRLSECSQIVGLSRRAYSDAAFRENLQAGVAAQLPHQYTPEAWQKFQDIIHYFPGDIEAQDDIPRLKLFLEQLEKGPAHRLYYLAIAPEHYASAVISLGRAGMAAQEGCWRRIIIEKPFGRDLQSARALNATIRTVFDESQVFRIDHYLGKETAQNILFLRFANAIFEPIWNRQYIDNVQIHVTESVEVGHRAEYYDSAGVLRDMFQNHLQQLLALVAMEPPSSFQADPVRNEKLKVFNSIRPVVLTDTVRGQYSDYCNLEGIKDNSQTPTFAAIKLFIDNWRWQGVPFYLRSGKALAQTISEIGIEFKRPPHLMFHRSEQNPFLPNTLSLRIQPDEGIRLTFQAKQPGSNQEMQSVEMEFLYRKSFQQPIPEAYEKLLLDALEGDASLFTRNDGIEACWQNIDPIDAGWEQQNTPPLFSYPKGSWGPVQSDELIRRDGREWHVLHRTD
jgi:glucose-6-phosphate 1-dehydrogenase